ncbi:M50 family metallopeptidase [Labrys neptuniae]
MLFLILFPFVLFAAQIFATALHELGHALAGRLAGIAIAEIQIGRAPWRFSLRFGETNLLVGQRIDGGCVVPYWQPHPSRLRNIVFVAAGPAVDLILMAVAIWVAIADKVPAAFFWVPVLVAIVEAALAYKNLRPRAGVTNDIRLILDEMQADHSKATPLREFYLRSLAGYWDGNGVPPALSRRSACIGTLLYEQAGNSDTRFDWTHVPALERELRRPLQKFEALLILERLSTCVLVDWRLDLARDLDRWTRQALELAPEIATVRGTRGAALCILGCYEEAEALLNQADYSNAFNKFYNHLFLAWATHGRGDQVQALAHFDEAAALCTIDGEQHHDALPPLARHIAARIGIALPAAESDRIESTGTDEQLSPLQA